MAHEKTGWHLNDQQANYTSDYFSFQIDLSYPEQGVLDVAYHNAPTASLTPLKIALDPPTPKGGETIIESYIRGDDLIVHYAQTPARTAHPEISWTHLNDDGAVGLQAMISMQTSLLDSDPTIRTQTSLGSGALVQLTDLNSATWETRGAGDTIPADSLSLFLFRPDEADWSYAELVYPADFQGARVNHSSGESGDGLAIAFSLFSEFLEKGVIRRGRLQALFLPREQDEQLAIAGYQRLADSEAPLTT